MSTASPGWMPQLQRVVGRVFYHHGLFCANNPLFVLSVVVIVFLVSLAPLLSLSQVDQEVEPRAVRWAGPVVPEQADIQEHDGPLLAVQPITVSFPEAASANADVAKAVLLVLETLQKRIEAFTLQNEYVALLWLTHGCVATLLYLTAQTNFAFRMGTWSIGDFCYKASMDSTHCLSASPMEFWQACIRLAMLSHTCHSDKMYWTTSGLHTNAAVSAHYVN
jgi:hypothetical protein